MAAPLQPHTRSRTAPGARSGSRRPMGGVGEYSARVRAQAELGRQTAHDQLEGCGDLVRRQLDPDYQTDFTFLGYHPPFSDTFIKSSLQSGSVQGLDDSPSRPRIGVGRTRRDPAGGRNGFFCGDGGPWMRLITLPSQPKFEFRTSSI